MSDHEKIKRIDKPFTSPKFHVGQTVCLIKHQGSFPRVNTIVSITVGWPVVANKPRWVYSLRRRENPDRRVRRGGLPLWYSKRLSCGASWVVEAGILYRRIGCGDGVSRPCGRGAST